MNTLFYASSSRGSADYGWLRTRYAFSFADYYNPERMGFGALRVLNDDVIAPGAGFGKHPHQDMEIVTIPLEGTLRHEDSMGNGGTLVPGEIQVMSAGTGIVHAEFNASKTESLKLLQIWVHPREEGLLPRYAQKAFDPRGEHNAFACVVAPEGSAKTRGEKGALGIQQDARFSLCTLGAGKHAAYTMQGAGCGAYAFVIAGEGTIAGARAGLRDAISVTSADSFEVRAKKRMRVLVIEVPFPGGGAGE